MMVFNDHNNVISLSSQNKSLIQSQYEQLSANNIGKSAPVIIRNIYNKRYSGYDIHNVHNVWSIESIPLYERKRIKSHFSTKTSIPFRIKWNNIAEFII